MYNRNSNLGPSWQPALDVSETAEAYLIHLEVPGVSAGEIDVDLANNILTIVGEKQRPYEAENRAHFRKKWKLGWARRRWEKAFDGLRAWWWRSTERARFGHTLHEKWDGERLRYY